MLCYNIEHYFVGDPSDGTARVSRDAADIEDEVQRLTGCLVGLPWNSEMFSFNTYQTWANPLKY